MKEHKVKLSFNIPVDEHVVLKNECDQAKISIEDFLHNLVLKGIRDLQKKQLHKNLKKSVQQAKDGKVKSRGSFAKYVDDEV